MILLSVGYFIAVCGGFGAPGCECLVCVVVCACQRNVRKLLRVFYANEVMARVYCYFVILEVVCQLL